MLFNSYAFWFFFAAVFLLYRVVPHKWQNRLLLVASGAFYAAWDWRFLSLLLVCVVANYAAGLAIQRSSSAARRKAALIGACCVNLGLLGFFKYYGFFSAELNALLGGLGLAALLPTLKIVLPVGISFFTFKAVSYTVDVYRRKVQATGNLLHFALYIAFFPPLLAGPIDRAGRFLPQVAHPRKYGPDDFRIGLYMVLYGLFKKVVIADNMASIVNAIFATPVAELTGLQVLLGVYAFAFQLYGDFSGYSLIARGVAKWLGFDLMVNFRIPYVARTPSEFWQRWHISLSTWLRDYLYIPLGGNRKGRFNTYRNLMLTMALGGLWHGAGWTYVCWGVFHGLILCIYRLFERPRTDGDSAPLPAWRRAIALFVMFHLVCLGWLLFRADSMTQVWQMTGRLVGDFRPDWFAAFCGGMLLFYLVPMALLEYWLHRKDDLLALTKAHWLPRAAVYVYFVFMLWFFAPETAHAFIYFQF